MFSQLAVIAENLLTALASLVWHTYITMMKETETVMEDVHIS